MWMLGVRNRRDQVCGQNGDKERSNSLAVRVLDRVTIGLRGKTVHGQDAYRVCRERGDIKSDSSVCSRRALPCL